MAGPGGKEVGRLSLKVLPDTSLFAKSLKAYAERVERQIQVQLPVDLDTGMAQAQMKLLLLKLKAMAKAGKPTINADFDSAGVLAATTAARGMSNAFDGANTNANLLARSVLVVLPIVLAVASAAAAIGPALAVAVPLVGALGAGIAVMVAGWGEFREAIEPIAQAWGKLQKPVGNALTAGLIKPFKTFADSVMPRVQSGLKLFAGVVNLAVRGLLRFFNAGAGKSLLADTFKALATAARPFARLLPALVEMFMRLAIAAAPAMKTMGKAILGAVQQFNRFLESGKATGAISAAMSTLGAAISGIGRFVAAIFPDLVAMFPAVAAAFSGIGAALSVVFRIFGKIGAFAGKYPTLFSAIAAAVTAGAIAFGVMSAAMLVLNTAMSANPIVKIITLLAALVAVLIYAYNNSETFRASVQRAVQATIIVFNALKGVVMSVVNFITGHLKQIGFVLAVIGAVVLAFVAPWLLIAAAVAVVVGLIIKHWSTVKAFIAAVFAGIIATVMIAWTFIKTIITTSIALVSAVIRTGVMIWRTIFMVVFAVIRAVISAAWAVIKGVVRVGIAAVTAAIRGVMVIVGIFRAAFNAGRAVVSAVIGVIRSVVSAGISVVLSVIRRVSAVAGFFRSAFNAGKSAVTSVAGAIVSFVKGIPGKIKSALTFDLSGAGRALMQGFVRGVTAIGQKAIDAAKNIASKIKGLLPGSPIRYGPLKSWNRGGAGKRLMNLLAQGIGAREAHVIRQVQHTARAMDRAWSVPSLAAGFAAAHDMSRMGATVSASVGAIVDNTVSPGAQEIVISNWQTGLGTMEAVADDALAAQAFVNAQHDRMGV